MPYIPQKDRFQYDALVDELAEKLRSLGSNDAMVGPLSYIVSTLVWPLCPLGIDKPTYGMDGRVRYQYAKMLEPLTEKLDALVNDAMVGALNYIVSRLTWQLCGHGGGERRYARMNIVVGALDCVKSELKRAFAGFNGFSNSAYVRTCAVVGALDCAKCELQRRIMAPYEDEKIESAGDVKIFPGD